MNPYKKIVKWKKKPRMPDLILGIIGSLIALGIIILSISESSIAAMTFIFTIMFCYSFKLMNKNRGIGKEVYYLKLNRKKGR